MSSAQNIRTNDELNERLVDKKGTYILEASLVIPPLIIIMILLISVVSLIGTAEKTIFIMSEELKIADIEALVAEVPIAVPVKVYHEVKKLGGSVDRVSISDYEFLHSDMGVNDLISIGVRLGFSGLNPLGRYSLLNIEQRVRSRAFTGLDRSGDAGEHALSGYEVSEIVYVFPNRGERYHKRNCPFLNPACEKVFLTREVRSRFKVCTSCNSGSAKTGDVVFCFFNDGKVFHLGSCSAVEKYYIEMEKKDAELRGYSACGTCGG